jgi:hypothetical protein
MNSFCLSEFAARPNLCGKFFLPYTAIFSLRLLGGVIAPPISIDQTKQFQKIIYTKRGSARRDACEGILRHHIRHVAQKRLKRTGLVVVENSILTPVESPRHQLVLCAAKRMKRMRYSEPTRGVSQTTCSRRLSPIPLRSAGCVRSKRNAYRSWCCLVRVRCAERSGNM